MIMEKRGIGCLKRDVATVTVAGQFEDPEDEETQLYTQSPKRSRRNEVPKPVEPVTGPSVPAPTRKPAPVTQSTTRQVDPVSSVRPMPHPSPVMIPSCMMPVPMAMIPHTHPMHPMAAAAWQQQQTFLMTHMMTMMNPVMQQMQSQLMHQLVTNSKAPPGSGYVPPHVKPQPLQPQQHQQEQKPLGLDPNNASSLVDEEWRIPYSHNYHPKIGFLQENIISPTANDSSHTTQSSGTKSSRCDLEMPIPLDETFLKDTQFPRVQEDIAKQFGLKEWEVTKTDVLCGRGGVTNSHEGNIYYRSLADQFRWDYATVQKSRKADVAKVIVRKIRERHGRFLKKEGDSWYEIGDELALAKAAQTLREGLAKICRDGLKAKMETDRRMMSVREVVAAAAPVTPLEDTETHDGTTSARK